MSAEAVSDDVIPSGSDDHRRVEISSKIFNFPNHSLNLEGFVFVVSLYGRTRSEENYKKSTQKFSLKSQWHR